MGLLEKMALPTLELSEKKIEEVVQRVLPEPVREIVSPVVEIENEIVDEDQEEKNEQSAEALIDMIDLTQKALFGFWGAKKLKKKIPTKVMEEFISIDLKDLAGEDLTEDEKKKLAKYKDFDRRMQFLMKEIPFTDEEREELLAATKAFVKDQKINIPPTLWFSVQVLSKASERFITVATM